MSNNNKNSQGQKGDQEPFGRKTTDQRQGVDAQQANAREQVIKRKRMASLIRTVLFIFILLLMLFLATETFGVGTLSSISGSVRGFINNISPGDGYPYRISSSSVKSMDMISSNVILLTNNSTVLLDSTAKEIAKIQHTYASPSMTVKNGRAIVFDRGGTRYMIVSQNGLISEGETKNKILTCDAGKSGNIAIATLGDDAASVLTVYSGNLSKVIFQWVCYSESIVDVSLSDDGKSAAVVVVGANQGEVVSKVYVFFFDYMEALAVFEYQGTSMFDVNFIGKSTIVAMGDNVRSVIKNKTERQKDISYSTSTVMRYSKAENGYNAVLMSQYGSTNLNVLTVYNKNNNITFNQKLKNTIKNIYYNNKKIKILINNKIL
ncbi:MAG: DUF5711 family protein, partial [Oscillospiraceae bacterium]|nr:DUF5711 family protein [Oscillospiraceae bacterium]